MPGFTKCGAACVNTASDANHCGACDVSCSNNPLALSGFCKNSACECAAGYETCDGACKDKATYQTDPANCGQCGTSCAGDGLTGECAGGLCTPVAPTPPS